MRRSIIFERNDPLFEDTSISVAVGRFPLLRQTSRSGEVGLTIRVLSGTSTADQSPVLRVEVVGEDTEPFVLYLAEITVDIFAQIKEEQALRVDFDGFTRNVVQLFEKCTKNEFKVALVMASLAPATVGGGGGGMMVDESDNTSTAAILNVFETTPFRELSHLTLRVERATEAQTRQYLWERLRQENRRLVSMNHSMKQLREETNARAEETRAVQAQLEAFKLQMQAERLEFQQAFERRHADALREARLEITDEERERKERDNARIVELEARLRAMEEELARAKDQRAHAEAEAVRSSGASDALSSLRAEATELRSRCRELESRAFEESSRSARLQEHVAGLERELGLKEDTAQRTNELLRAERERIHLLQDELEQVKSRWRDAEHKVGSSSAQIAELEHVRDELESLKQKVRTKNAVIREQERVVIDQNNEIQRLKGSLGDAQRDLSLERTKTSELRTKIGELKQHLEESAKMLEANSNVITYLNRELSNATLSTPAALYDLGRI